MCCYDEAFEELKIVQPISVAMCHVFGFSTVQLGLEYF